MNRIEALFQVKQRSILSVYCTAGYPLLDSTVPVMMSLQQNGADMIELGMPYSDPLADGPVIQQSSMLALQNGMTINKIFEQLRGFRHNVYLPVLLMGYMNPVLQYGFEQFCKDAADVAIDGLIIPDLPMYEFENEYGVYTQRFGLSFIFMITPETSEERIRKIDELTSGFIYAVSSSSTTGKNTDLSVQQSYFERLKNMKLRNPILVGFGIRDKQTFNTACTHLNGAIIGTAYINAIEGSVDVEDKTKAFLTSILQ
ncbi:MAG TPA: tryptophan synthase subunit alpha [Chitinophagaceae bacterium]|jgi:tryptophan synthase alpha chain|nr:tryptophan synthase subunit alpha [Chitinophagaceae bacterium]